MHGELFNRAVAATARLGIDARMFDYTGIGRFLQGLIGPLAEAWPGKVALFVHADAAARAQARAPQAQIVVVGPTVYHPAAQLALPAALRRAGVDVLVLPHYPVPLLWRGPIVAFIQDLMHLDAGAARAAYLKLMLRDLRWRGARLATLSRWTREQVVRRAGIPPEGITVIPPGLEASFAPGPVDAAVPGRYGLPEAYFLYLGQWKPNKNLARLIAAYAQLRQAGPAPTLVIGGKPDPRFGPALEAAAQACPPGSVLFPGFIDEADLPALYRAATAFVFPSLDEGFGLPPLEAMACGCPVIASNAASLPEAVGDAALMVNPLDEAGLTAAMYRVANESSLRKQLVAKGLAHAARFTWTAAGRAVASLAADALAGGARPPKLGGPSP